MSGMRSSIDYRYNTAAASSSASVTDSSISSPVVEIEPNRNDATGVRISVSDVYRSDRCFFTSMISSDNIHFLLM
jgi:hypothetical protein